MQGRTNLRVALGVATLLGVVACDVRQPAHAEAGRSVTAPLRVTIIGDPGDPRLPAVREALAFWNAEAARLGLLVRLDSGTLHSGPVPDDALRAASRGMPRDGLGILRLRAALSGVPGDVVITLAQTDLISFGASRGTGRVGVVGLRPADRWPLSLPNTVRNVAAHELGHVLGLAHNADSTTLMCGRPAPCRPAVFASPHPRFFPLTRTDEEQLRRRWR